MSNLNENEILETTEIENENEIISETDSIACDECGTVGNEEDLYNVFTSNDVKLVCKECLQNMLDDGEVFQCDECGDYYEWNNGEHDNSHHYCHSCYIANNLFRCEDCGNIYASEDCTNVIENWRGDCRSVCGSCLDEGLDDGNYFCCDHCGNYYTENYVHVNNITICDECYDDHYVTCEECGDYILYDNSYCDEDGELYYCSDCWNEGDYDNNSIKNYSYKPTPMFNLTLDEMDNDYNILYEGVELEVDNGTSKYAAAKAVREGSRDNSGKNNLYCKSDGSLCSGFEIVSHPSTLKYHTEEMHWDDIFNTLKEYRFRSHDTDTCGLHVHVNRDFFGESVNEQDLHIAKLIMLVDKFWDKIVVFSRRKLSNLNRWASKNNIEITEDDLTTEIIEKVKSEKVKGRYRAINLQNTHTVEFRIFRGTLKYNTFLATLQFVETLCCYAKQINLSDIWKVNFEDVFNNTEYTELREYLAEKELID